MIELSEIIFPTLIFLLPLILATVILFDGGKYKLSIKNISVFLYLAIAIIATIGVFHFKDESRMDLMWGVAPGSSSEFEFSLHLGWPRFVWILCVNLCFACFEFFRESVPTQKKQNKVVLLLPLTASFFSSLAFLSENYILSVMFIEVMLFLLYAHAETDGGSKLEFSAYFKRATYILSSLLLLFIFSYLNVIDLPSVVLLAAVTYILAIILSRSELHKVHEHPLFLIQMATSLFLLNRLMHFDLAPELWLGLSILFGLISLIFSVFSLFSPGSTGSIFWLSSSIISFLLFMRFGSNKPHLLFWGGSEALGLLAIFAMGMLFQSNRAELWKKVISAFLLIFSLLVLSGSVPGLDLLNPDYQYFENPMHLLMLGGQMFMIAASAGLSLMFSATTNNKEENARSIFYCWLPSIFVIICSLVIFVNFVFLEPASGSLDILMGEKAQLFFLTIWPSALLGVLLGFMLSANKRFLSWAGNKKVKAERFNFEIAESFSAWNAKFTQNVDDLISSISQKSLQKSLQFSEVVQSLDRKLFGEKIPHGSTNYAAALSAFIRRTHSGNYRWYSFFGTFILFLVGIYYLVGWK